MGFFARFQLWLQRFMYGRNGPDQLSMVIMMVYLVLYLIAQIFRWPILAIVSLVLLIWCFFRMLSRNITARRKENQAFLSFFSRLKRSSNRQKSFRKDKDHRYYKCPKCGNILRVPRGKGKIEIKCPVCKTEFIKKT